jgi:hypothetical protein
MKKQSAVQWLVEQVNSDCLNSAFIRPELVEQAKEMEKEQIIYAHIEGQSVYSFEMEKSQRYYKETYGGNK